MCLFRFSAEFAFLRKLLTLQIEMLLWRGDDCVLYKGVILYKRYSFDVLRDNDEIRFVCWGEGGLRRNQGESGSSGLI